MTSAYNINDRGEIVGNGMLANGEVHDCVLIPCGDGDAACADTPAAPAAQRSTIASPALGDRPSEMLNGLRNRFPGRRALGLAVGPIR